MVIIAKLTDNFDFFAKEGEQHCQYRSGNPGNYLRKCLNVAEDTILADAVGEARLLLNHGQHNPTLMHLGNNTRLPRAPVTIASGVPVPAPPTLGSGWHSTIKEVQMQASS